ncbi:CAAX prenyl protease 1 [Entophlyctis luteolus]|nr:CAAX prenyl protease 1 [Entophlyctis luteolus]
MAIDPFGDVFPYRNAVLATMWTIYFFEQYLALRQHLRLANPKLGVPTVLKGEISEEDHEQAKKYGLAKSEFEFVQNFFNQVVATITILLDIMPAFWKVSSDILLTLGLTGDREILQSVVFAIVSTAVSTVLSWPFSLYKNFVIEEKFGFNKTTLPLFISDKVKELLLTSVIIAPLVAGILLVIQWGGKNFFLYVGGFILVFQVIMILLFPTVIAPLFNKFTPLEEGELKTMISALAAKVNFPLTKVFVIDGSKRSSHSNAYFTGLFKDKRIVLFDTLLNQQTHQEILAVLAHELGHWQKSHILSKLVVLQVQFFCLFYTFSHFIESKAMYRAFGFDTQPVLVGLVLFSYIYQPIDSITSFLTNWISRMHEFQADAYAKKLGYAEDLKSGLIKLHKKNLGNLIPDSWYSAWHYSHPPLVERLAAIGKVE